MVRPLLLLALLLLCGLAPPAARAGLDPMAEPRFVTASGTAAIVDGTVGALAQDERGLIWVGTSTGLVRYDGYQAQAYLLTENGAPVHRFVRTLLPGPGGVLWVGSDGGGLARFDTLTETWTHYRPDPARADAIGSGSVERLAAARDGGLWVGLINGLDHFDPASGRFTHHRAADGTGLPDDHVNTVLVDRAGDLWVGTWGGLVRLPVGGELFESVGGAELAGAVNVLAQAPDGRLWVGLRDGRLVELDPVTRARRVFDAPDAEHGSPVLSLCFVGDELWVGRATGVELRRLDGSLLMTLGRSHKQPWALDGTHFAALLLDRAGTLWVGSYGNGLQRYEPGDGALWVRRQDEDPASPLADTDVRSVLQLQNGEIWLGTLGRGIAVLDRQLRSIAALTPDARFQGMVVALAQAPGGEVWAGTGTGTLYRFDAQRRLAATLAGRLPPVRRLMAGRDGTLWIGTLGGLRRLAPGAGEAVHVARQGGGLVGKVNALVEEGDQLWVGTESGLFRLADDGLLQPVAAGAGLPAGAAGAAVLGLLLDARGRLWADTSTGLFLRTATGRFELQGAAEGFGGRGFGANLLADTQGRLWTHRGMFDPANGVFTEFGKSDGVDIGIGWFRAYAQLDDGRMLFGGSTGLLVAEPERFRRWSFRPPVVATELRIDGRPAPLGGGLRLAPGQRAFSVRFTALDYSAPAHNRYRHRLLGYDEDWLDTDAALRVASYANLAPGRYTLEVQGSNRLGDWSETTLRVPVDVLPAWWQTWWSHAGGVLLAVLAVWGLVHWRTRALERRRALLEARVRERTAELQALTEALKESSLSDPLTGLHNRRYLTQHIEADVALARRRRGDLGFLLIDVDHFKQVNDVHGHSAGDAVLVQMSERLREASRGSDHVVRWGGEEFLVVAREGSRAHVAELAERIRRAVADRPFLLPDGQQLAKTCSVGFACFPLSAAQPKALDWSAVVDVADGALYEAKRSGRNRWVGITGADAALDAAALQALLAQPPAQWLASHSLTVLRS